MKCLVVCLKGIEYNTYRMMDDVGGGRITSSKSIQGHSRHFEVLKTIGTIHEVRFPYFYSDI